MMNPKLAVLGLVPVIAAAFSGGAPPNRAGVPTDQAGITCTACHRGTDVNGDARGRLWLSTDAAYRPGVRQMIKINIAHPEGARWGFQLTARLARDETRAAGTFTAVAGQIRVQCGAGGPEGNCGGQTEFASHVQASTFNGQGGGAEWTVEWTPPAAGGGEVIFYVAGNAANSSGNNQGDLIYNTNMKIAEDGGCNLTATPTITRVTNATSFEPQTLSFNSLFTVFGTGLQATGGVSNGGEYINGRKFPNRLGCIAIEVAGERAPITYAQFNQINAQIPTINNIGDVQVRVIANPGQPNERRSEPTTIRLASASPSFFRLVPTPCIAAVFANTGEISGDPSLLSFTKPAKVGDIVILFLTGLGATNPIWQSGEIVDSASRIVAPVEIELNGRAIPAADVLYVGTAAGAISGLAQINMRIPAGGISFNAQNEVRIRIGTDILSPAGTTLYISN
ncbi:MAG: hypothetical protein FJW39_27955 [Acidobacteria bacterium]|nr:hypothetical protein [Acidobacteriota bacterium]